MDSSNNYSENQAGSSTFRDYLAVLFRQMPIVVVTIVTVLITTYVGLTLKTPVYVAQVKMLISAEKMVHGPNYRDLQDNQGGGEVAQTQSEIVTSAPVLKRAIQALRLDQLHVDYEKRYASKLKGKLIDYLAKANKNKMQKYSPEQRQARIMSDTLDNLRKRVKVEPIRDTDMFTISVEDFDPTNAANTANVIARSYVIFDLEQQLADLSLEYGDKQTNVLQLKDNISKMVANLNGNPLSNIEAIGPATVKIIEQADVPIEPVGTRKIFVLTLGLVMSIFLALMLAFAFEYMDPTFNSPQQLEGELNLPFLGSVPRCGLGEKLLIHAFKAKTRYTRFYQILSDQLYLLIKDNHLKSVLVTAPGSREATSMIVVNLGLYLSRSSNHSVLLIDANFRRPTVHQLLRVKNTEGLANVIEDKALFKDVVREVNKNLHIVTAGKTDLNPVILLNSPKVKELIEEAKKKYEVILIDCPNVMGYKESLALAEKTDATVFVISEGKTRRNIAKIALQSLLTKKANVLGVILNNRTFPIPKFVYERV